MSIASVIQVGPKELFPAQLQEAARSAFPDAQWTETAVFPPPSGSDFNSSPDSASAPGSDSAPGSMAGVFPGDGADEEGNAGKSGGGSARDPLSPPDGGGVLLLFTAGSAAAGAARVVPDGDQLPRWAVVEFGAGAEALPVEDWTAPRLAHALRSAAALHREKRENARLRGDLLTLARRVSHDLRTPLGGVLATVDMLAEITPDGAAAVRPLFSSVDEITGIINRVSFLLKAVARPLPKQLLPMGPVVREAVMRLERLITRTGATLIQPPAWPQAPGVESWLEVVWWNLLHNALRHSGPSPVITLGWERAGDAHRFQVRDRGPGVPAAARPGLFPPFHLLHDANAPRGFGLPIVRRLIELQGGRCGFEALPEGGSEFSFLLPDAL